MSFYVDFFFFIATIQMLAQGWISYKALKDSVLAHFQQASL